MERSKLLEEKKAALEIRERRIIAALCSQKPSSEEVQWYERQMKLFESDDPEVCFAAMDNMIGRIPAGKQNVFLKDVRENMVKKGL